METIAEYARQLHRELDVELNHRISNLIAADSCDHDRIAGEIRGIRLTQRKNEDLLRKMTRDDITDEGESDEGESDDLSLDVGRAA